MFSNILKFANWVDILILISLLRCAYIGQRKGLYGEIFKCVGIIVALVVSLYNCRQLGKFIAGHSFLSIFYSNILSFIALLLATLFIFRLIRAVVGRLMKVEFGTRFDGLGGAILGLARGGIIASLILVFLTWLPTTTIEERINQNSYLGPSFIKVVPAIYDGVMKFYRGDRALKGDQVFGEFVGEKERQLRERAKTKVGK